jgi:hypothetical protein
LQHHAENAAERDIQEVWTANQQAHRITHRSEISANVDRVRDKEETDDSIQQGSRVMTADVTRDPAPSRAPDPATDLLNSSHQWIAKQHRPGNAEAELGAHLGVSGDAAGIVIRCTANESRPKIALGISRDSLFCLISPTPSIPILNVGVSPLYQTRRNLCHRCDAGEINGTANATRGQALPQLHEIFARRDQRR